MHREVLGPRWSKNHVAFWIRDAFIAAVLLMSALRIGVWFMSLMPGDVAPPSRAVPPPIVHPPTRCFANCANDDISVVEVPCSALATWCTPYLAEGLTPTTIAPW